MQLPAGLERYIADLDANVALEGIGKSNRRHADIRFHARHMAEAVFSRRCQKIVELGTCTGEGLTLLSNAACADGDVWTVDIRRKNDAYKDSLLRRYPPLSRIHVLTGDSADPSVVVQVMTDGKMIDALFVDSSHLRDRVLKEVAAWFPHLADDAVVFFHDAVLCHDTVKVTIDDLVEGLNIHRWCADFDVTKHTLHDVPGHPAAGIAADGRPLSQVEVDDRRPGATECRVLRADFSDDVVHSGGIDLVYELLLGWPGLVTLTELSSRAKETMVAAAERLLAAQNCTER